MVTKAVHLELVEGLSTQDFIQAFLNFTGIRGVCTRLWSDNGTNFQGAEKELRAMLRSWREMDMGKLLQKYSTYGMAFHYSSSTTSRRTMGSGCEIDEISFTQSRRTTQI